MSDISRSSVSGTTEPAAPEEDGSRARQLGISREIDWIGSTPMNDLRYWLWEASVRIRHRFGYHTFVDIENWTDDDGLRVVTIVGQGCWLCPERR